VEEELKELDEDGKERLEKINTEFQNPVGEVE